MIKLVIFAVMAAAVSAAPYYPDRHGGYGLQPYFNDDFFDTHRFWTDMERELRQLDEMLASFHRQFPHSDSSAGLEGNQYKFTIRLPGFDSNDIIVKAREGVLMVQAVHRTDETTQRHYLAIYTLPENVDLSGVWTFDNEILTVTFPVKGSATSTTTVAPTTSQDTLEIITRGYSDREEMDKNDDSSNLDADVGVQDSKDHAIATNEIQAGAGAGGVEATTYSVDLKDEVEFVPVQYK